MLAKYEGRQVVVETDNKKIFRGKVIDYCSSEDNETGIESIIIRDIQSGKLIELVESDIKTIDIIN